jgi:hypothetical protein
MLAGQYEKAGHYFDLCYRLCERIERQDLRAGVLFRMAELAQIQGEGDRAAELAQQAEAIAGTEAPPTRNRAVVFRAQMGGDRWNPRSPAPAPSNSKFKYPEFDRLRLSPPRASTAG